MGLTPGEAEQLAAIEDAGLTYGGDKISAEAVRRLVHRRLVHYLEGSNWLARVREPAPPEAGDVVVYAADLFEEAYRLAPARYLVLGAERMWSGALGFRVRRISGPGPLQRGSFVESPGTELRVVRTAAERLALELMGRV